MARVLFIPAFDKAEATIIAESVARGETTSPVFTSSTRAEADLSCAHLNRNRPANRPRYQVFEMATRETTTHDGRIMVAWAVDKVGDVAATVALFASIAIVGWASCWEATV
jgi:hypothetical protein